MGARTPLYDWHAGHKAKLVDFAGWDMPVIYSSISEEHLATRQNAGLFDISHMGRLRFEGPSATAFLDRMLSNRVDNLRLGQVRYALVLNEQGGIRDDVLVTRFADHYLVVVNASNRPKLLEWFRQHLPPSGVTMVDQTIEFAMIACQGPKANAIAQPLTEVPIRELKYYFAAPGKIDSSLGIVSRTGYTGEDGVEFILPSDIAVTVWEKLVAAGATPAALGARDTLRLEAAMPLYGHELTEDIDPIQAGLGWAVKSKDKDFIGKSALATRDPHRAVRVGLRLADKRIARENFVIQRAGRDVGRITSGTFGPTVNASIAMGYVPPGLANVGNQLEVLVRNQAVTAEVVGLPFYVREK